MTESQRTFKRATVAALIGLFAQGLLTLVAALLGIYARSEAIYAATWYLLGGVPIWMALWLLFKQHQLECQEALEAEQIAESDAQAAALFQEAGDQLSLARRRLASFYRWGLNIVGLLVAIYLATLGIALCWLNAHGLSHDGPSSAPLRANANLGTVVLLLFVMAFVAFLVARYVAGMTEVRQWQALRAGAAYLMGNALVAGLLLLASGGLYLGNDIALRILAVAIPGAMVLLAIEIVLTLVFSLYRPRRADEFVRPAFDSRLLGLLTRPESLGNIISDTLNYQFGFEISRSWFYRLLSQATLPLALVCGLVVITMSGIVFVPPQQNAVITTFGQLEDIKPAGVWLKWPWPISRAKKYDVARVQQITLGSTVGKAIKDTPTLWTNPHTVDGVEDFLVTAPSPTIDEQVQTRIAAGELVGVDITISYRIADLDAYVRSATDPEAILRVIADRQIGAYFAAHDIDALLTADRIGAGKALRASIRESAEEQRLGLDILLVTIPSVHPPQAEDVAKSFHEQIGALQEKQSTIQEAQIEAIAMLAEVAGSRAKALAISRAISDMDAVRQLGSGDLTELSRKQAQIERLVDEAGGEAAVRILNARSERWRTAVAERARAESFQSALDAYRKVPQYYKMRLYLEALEAMADRPKTVLSLKGGSSPTIRLDLKDNLTTLDNLVGSDQE